MKFRRCLSVGIGVVLCCFAAPALAEERGSGRRPMALGVQLDLFPTVVSAVNGKAGYAPQMWLGLGAARVRLVGAHLEPPDSLAFAGGGFENPTITVFVVGLDYTFGEHFDGWWLGTGFEIWQRSIGHTQVEEIARWSSIIATFGGGYIWRFAGNFFLDPWLGVHATLNPESVRLGSFEYDPPPVVANGSVKVGWFVDL